MPLNSGCVFLNFYLNWKLLFHAITKKAGMNFFYFESNLEKMIYQKKEKMKLTKICNSYFGNAFNYPLTSYKSS